MYNNNIGLLDKAVRQHSSSVVTTESSPQANGLLSVFVPTPYEKGRATIANNTFTFTMNKSYIFSTTLVLKRMALALALLLVGSTIALAQIDVVNPLIGIDEIPQGAEITSSTKLKVEFHGGTNLHYGTDKYANISWSVGTESSFINGWADWNANGTFEKNERILKNHEVSGLGRGTFVTQAPPGINLGERKVVFTVNGQRTDSPNVGEPMGQTVTYVDDIPTDAEKYYPELTADESFILLNKSSSDDKSLSCGSGNFNYTNCENETIVINRANIRPNTFIYTDDDYLGCGVAFVDARCNVGPSVRSYCTDYNKSAPTPGAGSPYGTGRFTRVVGGFNAGYTSELALERINWVLCNGNHNTTDGRQEIDRAIWYYSGSNSSCGTLCREAASAVTSVQGGIENQMVFYLNYDGYQPFIKGTCSTSCLPYVYFENDGNCPVDIYFQNGSHEVFHETVASNEDFIVQSTPGHVWRIRNSSDNSLVRSYTVASNCNNQHVDVSSTACADPCSNSTFRVRAGNDVSKCDDDQITLSASVSGLQNCSSPGVSECNHSLENSGGYVVDASSAAFCGSAVGAKLWTAAGQGTSFVTIDFGTTVPTGTQVCVNMALEHCSSTFSHESSARIQRSLSPTSGFSTAASAVTFNNTSYSEFCYNLDSNTRYIRVSDNGSCSFRVDYVRYQTQGVNSGGTSFQWSGPGIVGASNQLSIMVDRSGVYTVSATDCNGCVSTDRVIVNLNTTPDLVCESNINGQGMTDEDDCNVKVCVGDNLRLSVRPNISSVVWTGPGGFQATGNAVLISNNISAAQAGIYYATLTTDDGCSVSKTINVGVSQSPDVNVTVDPSGCSESTGGLTFTFSDNASRTQISFSIDGGVTYPYTVADNAGSFSIDDLSAGSYGVFARWGNGDCPVDLGDFVIEVDQQSLTVDAGDDVAICSEDEVVLSATTTGAEECSTPGVSDCNHELEAQGGFVEHASSAAFCGSNVGAKLWTRGGQGTSFVTIDFHEAVAAGTEICVNLRTEHCSNSSGNFSTAKIQSSLSPSNGFSDLVSAQHFTNTHYQEYCYTLSSAARYVRVIDNGGCAFLVDYVRYQTQGDSSNGITYQWSGPGIVGASDQMTITVNQSGTYTVSVRDCAGRCTAVDQVEVTLNDNPILVCESNVGGAGFVVENDCAVSLCEGESLSLSISPNSFVEVVWEGPNGFSATGNEILISSDITATEAGEYTATVTDSQSGCSGSTTITVEVKPNPTGTIIDQTVCGGESETLTVTPTVGDAPFTYEWSNQGGNGRSATFSPTATTVYTVTITDDNGCVGTAEGTISVNGIANSGISGPNEICANESTVYSVSTITPGATYAWTFNGPASPTTASGPTAAVTYNDQGPFLIELTVTSQDGCVSSSNTTINVRQPITADAGSDQAICQGGVTVLDGSNSVGTSFSWSIVTGDPTSIDGSTESQTLDVSPLFNTVYQLAVRDASGVCVRTDEVEVIIDVDQSPVADAVVAEELYCSGLLFTLDGSGSAAPVAEPDAVLNYLWYRGDPVDANFVGLGETLEQTATTTSDYTLIVSVDGNGTTCSDTATVTVNVVECASLGNFVFVDANGDGQQGNPAIEPGVEGVTVNLKDENGTVIATTETDENGLYSFDNLLPGDYSVQFELSTTGFNNFTEPNQGNDASDSDADPAMNGMTQVVTLAPGETNNTLDAGVVNTASLGDFVFLDENANGIQDAEDEGIEGVTVNLLVAGTQVQTTTTDGNGFYQFTDLIPGVPYQVEFPIDNGLEISPANEGGDDTADSDADPATGLSQIVVLESGENNPTIDAGYFETASLGDVVFLDENANGIQDAEDEGIEGVTVNLLVDGVQVATTTTDENGFYEFTDLTPGEEYQVQFPIDNGLEISPANEGGDDALDSDADPATGLSQIVVLESGENNPTIDAGYFETASLGDFVFEDTNGNGIQDDGEPGVEGVVVNLKDEEGIVIATTTTDENGVYTFEDLAPGTYSVQFELPADYNYTVLDSTGSNEINDSDADPAMDGMTELVTLTSGENNLDIDAGIQRDAEISLDKVFVSAVPNADGTYDVTYTIEIANAGGIGNYTVTDTPLFDDDVTINSGVFSGAAAGTLEVNGPSAIATDRMIAADATEIFTLVYNVTLDLEAGSTDGGDNIYTNCDGGTDEGVTGTPGTGLNNRADIDTNGDGIPDASDDDCGDLPLFDLALIKEVTSGTTYSQGDAVTYNITITNEGDIDATDVDVTDTPETGLVFQELTPQAGVTSTGDGSFTVASLLAGATVTVELSYVISATFQGTSLNNAAEITNDGPFDDTDSNPLTGPDTDEDGNGDGDDDDEDNVDVEINQTYDLAVDKSAPVASATPIAQGTELTYTITVTNEGSLDAADVEVTDRPDAGLTFVSETLPAGVTGTDGVYVVAALAQGESIDFEVTYVIDATFQGTSVRNEVEITGDDGEDTDSTPDNDAPDEDDQDEETTPIEQTYDLELNKTVTSAGPYMLGSTVSFDITVTNTGSLNANNVVIEDRAPTGLAFATVTGNVTDNGDGTFTVGEQVDPNGGTFTFNVSYVIDADFQGTSLTNIAEITGDDGEDNDSTPDNNDPTEDDQDDEVILINQIPSIAIEKATFDRVTGQFLDSDVFDTSSPVYVWGVEDIRDGTVPDVNWQYVVTNNGTLDLTNVQVTDDIEGLIGTIDFLPVGESRTLEFSATAIEGPYMNIGVAEGQPVDNNGVNVGDPISDSDPSNYLGSIFNIDKMVESREICEGTEANYSVTIRLSGQQFGLNARMIMVSDTLFFLESNTQEGFDLMPFITSTSDVNNNMRVDGGEEWVYEYSRTLTENTRNTAFEMFDIYRNDQFILSVSGDSSQTVTVFAQPVVIVSDVTPDSANECFGDTGGSLTASIVSGGAAPFTFDWSPGTTIDPDSPQGNRVINLAAGDYTVTITDVNGCITEASGTITEPTDITIEVETTDVECNGAETGTITLTIDGGVEPYTIDWADVPGADNDADRTGLTADVYTAVVTDANGCTEDVSATIDEASELTVTIDNVMVDCFGDTGELTVVVTGGSEPYTITWTNTVQNGATVTELAAGVYTAMIVDANGCEIETTGTITEPAEFIATVNEDEIGCSDDNSGELTVTAEGGTAPYTYLWENAGETTQTISGLTAGDYPVTITDANNCTTVATGVVNQSADVLTIVGATTEINCAGDDNATITTTVTGGSAPYTFEWSDSDATTPNRVGLAAGNYTITATDDNGCSDEESFVIEEGDVLEITISDDDLVCASGNELGSLTVAVTSGSGSYSYSWSDAQEQSTPTAVNLTVGTYNVTVTDTETGCSTVTSAEVIGDANACAELGNFVWIDTDNDGIQDADELGLEGVTVNLKDEDGNVIATTTTDENGAYLFTGLAPGTYSVQFVLPADYEWTVLNAGGDEATDSDADPAMNGMTEQVTLVAGESNLDLDAGLNLLPASLGDFVWFDANGDGVQNNGEAGVQGVTVNLKDEDGNVIATTTTDDDGFYSFTDLEPGTYSVQFVLIDGFVFTGANAGANDALDSDADPTMNGMTETVTLAPGEFNGSLDAGLVEDVTCELVAEITATGNCDNNGTDFDPSDDTYSVTILVDGTSPSGLWVSSEADANGNTVRGTVGVPATFTFATVAEPNPLEDFEIFFSDATDSECNASVTVTPVRPCSDRCLITSATATSSPVCDDNGTEANPDDDVFFLGITVTGNVNAGSGWTAFAPDGREIGSGFYDVENDAIGPFSISDVSGGEVLILIRDNDSDACAYSFPVTISPTLLPCSEGCAISIERDGPSFCDDNGTPEDPSDDVWFVSLFIDKQGNTNQYVTDAPGVSGPQFYTPGDATIFGPFPNPGSNNLVTIEISAAEAGSDCNASIVVQAPGENCSTRCDITGEILDIYCDDNGTPAISIDDVYFITVTADRVGINNGSMGWQVRDGFHLINDTIVGSGPIFGNEYTFGPLPLFDENGVRLTEQRFFIEDTEFRAGCRIDTVITLPEPCSVITCDPLTVNLGRTDCNDEGTADVGSDDTYSFEILVEGSVGNYRIEYNTPSGRVDFGTFGQTEVFEGIPVTTDVRGRVVPEDENCEEFASFFVPSTGNCVDCELSVTEVSNVCNDNDTADPSDDTFTVTLEITHSGEGVGYMVEVPGFDGIQTGTYADNATVSYTFPIEDGDVTLDFMDVTFGQLCNFPITLDAPQSCSTCDIVAVLDATTGCDQGDDEFDPSDDTFMATITVTGSGAGWTATIGGRTVNGDYGVPVTMDPFPTGTADLELRVQDVNDSSCSTGLIIPVPASCPSMAVDCNIEAVLDGTTDCNTGADEFSTADDTFTATFTVNGTDTGSGWTATIGGRTISGDYGVSTTEEFSTGTTDLEAVIQDVDDAGCTTTLIIPVPENCSEPRVCDIEASFISATDCNPNDLNDANDDSFVLTFIVNGTGSGWISTDGSQLSGEYGQTVVQVFPADTESFLMTFADADDADCTSELLITVPECPAVVNCEITAVLNSTSDCDTGVDAGTADDTFTATFTVTGNDTGSGWTTNIDGLSGEYGESVSWTFDANTDLISLLISDADDNTCTETLEISVPNCPVARECDIVIDMTSDPVCTEDGGYTFQVVVTNSGEGSDGGWTANDGLYTGQYGAATTISVADACDDFTLTVQDLDDADCTETLQVTAPAISISAPADTDMVNGVDLVCEDYNDIFNQDESTDLFGMPTVTGCGIESVDFEDAYLSGGPDGNECDDTVIQRVFTATACNGSTVTATQTITIRKPLVTDVIFPTEDVNFDCEDTSYPTDSNGNPATSVTGVPSVTTAFGGTVSFEDVFCGNISVSYADASGQTCNGAQTIERTWTATDACSNEVLTSVQIIRTGASIPTISCPTSNHYCPIVEENIMLFPMDHFDCVANFTVPNPEVTGSCGDNFNITTSIVNGAGEVILVIGANDDRNVTLEAGDYVFRYGVTDDCGADTFTECIFRVADTQEPAAICISDINVSVGGYGIARIYATMIDLASYDNCGIDSIMVRRQILVDPVTGDTLDEVTWSEWAEYSEVDCNDAGSIVTLQLRVVDGGGNANICTTNASVVDNTLPYCTGLEDLFLDCTDLPSDLDITDTLSLQSFFGRPVVIDNCAAESIELAPIVNVDGCMGAGTVIRRWLAVDGVGNVSAQEFTQRINISANMGFTLVLPKDTITNCLAPNQGFGIVGQSCADITVSYRDSIVEQTTADGDACMVVERQYTIINNCMFDPATDELITITRDEDCDGLEGESVFYAIVINDSTYVDVDTSFTNTIPAAGTRGTGCTGETNRAGYLRSVANTGGWTYTQRIVIFDETKPELLFEIPDTFCATEEDDCETIINVPITVSGECTDAGSNWLVLIDLERDGNPDERLPSEVAVQGTFPNYFIQASIPIGEHDLVLRYVDGCNNFVSIAIPFVVVDCSIPDPICYSGLIANLEVLDNPVTDEDGNETIIGTIVDAGRLASCDVEDCSGPLRYSVNRVGEEVNSADTEILLTCEDRYRVELEVYQWDNANNPYSVQPDGTIGGPNWKVCTVEVLVQDPDEVCSDCSPDGSLTLSGSITTPLGSVMPGVEVTMTGDENATIVSTDAGKYAFEGVGTGDFVITPFMDDAAGNGISTLDVLILKRHLLGIELITDPMRFMAADMNDSGTLTVIDQLIMRNVLLGNTDVLPNGESWRFVPVNYMTVVGNELARMTEAPNNIKLDGINACTTGNDFYAIKRGDLNNSVFIQNSTGEILNGLRGRSSNDTHLLDIEERHLRGGQLFDLPVRVSELEKLAGMQFTIGFADGSVTIEEVVPGLMQTNQLGLRNLERGLVSAAWTQGLEVTDGEAILFTIKARAQRSVALSNVLRLEDNPTFTEAYTLGEEEVLNVDLSFIELIPVVTQGPVEVEGPEVGLTADMELSQNFPNPFRDETTVTFDLPEAGEAQLNVYDLNGRILTNVEGEFAAGTHSVKLRGSDLGSGTMIYTLTYKGQRLTRTMIRTF